MYRVIYPDEKLQTIVEQLDDESLRISLLESGKRLLRRIKDKCKEWTEHQILEALLDDWVWEPRYKWIDATFTGYGLTSCNLIIEEREEGQDDPINTWWYPDYQIHSIPDKLLQDGYIILPKVEQL